MDTKKFDVIGIGHPLTAAGSAVGKFPPGLLQLPAVGCLAL